MKPATWLVVRLSLAVRVGIFALGCYSAIWSARAFSIASRAGVVEAYAKRIAGGERFKKDALTALRPDLIDLERTQSMHERRADWSVALVELRLAELSLEAGERIADNPQIELADATARTALKSNPNDAFLWYALSWIDRARYGFRDIGLRYMEMSYRVGPNEGWIAAHRSRDAVSVFSQLPSNLQRMVLIEFRNLVDANYVDDAADILAGPGWPERQVLVDAVAKLGEAKRKALAQQLEDRSVDIQVPGIVSKVKHKWDFSPG